MMLFIHICEWVLMFNLVIVELALESLERQERQR